MFRSLLHFGLALVVASLTSCGLLQKGWTVLKGKPKEKPAAAPQEAFIGVVESVNPEQKFVLVRMEMRMAIAPGTRLETRPEHGIKSVFTVTPERKLSFLSADIVEGLPARGDVVVRPVQAAPAQLAEATSAMFPAPAPSDTLGPPKSPAASEAPKTPAVEEAPAADLSPPL
ncbi:MAG: hypothetical protein ACOYMN_19575 [Roseimicrobium sp.]